ncbi:MAG: hypothetical protein IJB40_05440 [Alistipes sp.]|nr:hypothetical protein [Alistipes sp.]
MKRFAYYIACCTLVALCACTHDDTDDVIPVGNGKITIQASLDDMAITRATVEDTQAERKITHIDVFAVDENDNIAYYERNDAGNNNGTNEDGSGVLTLNVARRAKINDTFVFERGKEYKFYLVANATATETEMGAIKTLAALQQLIQDDSFIPNTDWASGEQTLLHLTGTTDLGTNPDKKVPETFLMDAVATDAQSNDAWVVNPTDGNLTNLNLSAEFKRAAAKIIVNITQGEDVEFHTEMQNEKSQYDFIMLPASTFVLPSDESLVGVKLVNTNPMEPNDQTFVWTSEKAAANNSIQVVGYTYAHFWDNANLKNETSLILNIPMMWNQDDSENKSKEAAAPRSWYKVPLSKDKKFERNTCYVVNVTINAVGAANRSTAIELDDIEYKTLDWVDVDINVGDDENRPAYLELNTDLVEIYNMNFDYTQLEFSSSSYIPNNFANENSSAADIENIKNNGGIILTDAYYYNYLDQKVELSTTAGDKYKIYANIKSTAEQDVLNGKINIDSPFVGISEQELYEKFGAAPVVPAMPTEPVNPVPAEAENPGTESEYAAAMSESAPENPKNNDKYYTYSSYIGRFYRITWTYNGKKWNEGDWREDRDMLNNYNNALAAWNTWNAWNSLSQAEKNAAIAKYEEDVATYSERLAYYNQQVAAKEKYDEDVAAYTAGKVDSHSNAIRYLVFEVYNETGQKATFTVAQYPTLYITNEMGYYSYRSDFGGTTYEKQGNPNYAGVDWNNNKWDYDYFEDGFFNSKVALQDGSSYDVVYYYWSNNSVNTYAGQDGSLGLDNPRMYHVHVTATSSKYTVGKPRLDSNGYTESSLENSKLVSPSFMIASQLGATMTPDGGVNQAKQHCEQYVEVTKNGKIYDDWRLPTAAEIEIIASHQDASDAMATVMTGWAYYCSYNVINGEVVYYQTTGKSGSNTAVRCIRDAY